MDDYRQSDEFASEIETYEAELAYRQQNNDDKFISSYATEQEYWEEYDEVKVGQLIECKQ